MLPFSFPGMKWQSSVANFFHFVNNWAETKNLVAKNLGIVVKFRFYYQPNLSQLINFYSPIIITKPQAFWWFQGE